MSDDNAVKILKRRYLDTPEKRLQYSVVQLKDENGRLRDLNNFYRSELTWMASRKLGFTVSVLVARAEKALKKVIK